MGSVFKSKEVYKKLKYDLHNRNEMVAVRGVYISGEYRPPYYNDTGIHIYQLTSDHTVVVDFRTEEVNASSTDVGGAYNVALSPSVFDIQRYSRESTDASPTETAGCYKFGVTASTYSINRYEKDYDDASPTETAGCYKLGLISSGYTMTRYYTSEGSSTPEPTLQITSLVSEPCVVTNYTP